MSSIVSSHFAIGLSPIRVPTKKVCPHKPARPSPVPRINRLYTSMAEVDHSFVSSIPEPPAKRRRLNTIPEDSDDDDVPASSSTSTSPSSTSTSSSSNTN